MADIVLTKDETGRLAGLNDVDDKRWRKFLSRLKSLTVGDTLCASFKIPRSRAFHRRHFAILAAVFKSQDQFVDPDKLREWLQVGAGFCDILPGPNGNPVAISRSIAWHNLEEADFAVHHAAVIDFMRSPRCTRFLWPHLDDRQQTEMIESIIAEFDA